MTKSLPEKLPLLSESKKKSLSQYLSTDASCPPHVVAAKIQAVLKEEERTNTLWRLAIHISLVSFFASLILCIAGIVCASLRSSASTAAFAADCLLDALASLIVFWRYWRAVKGYDVQEHLACLWLGGLIIVSSLGVIAKAIADLATQPESGNTQWLFWLSVAGSLAFILASIAKYWLYRLLQNESILLDSVNTLLSGLFCIAIAITVEVMEVYPDLWYLDPLEGGFFGLLMGLYGVKCFIDNCLIAWRSKKTAEPDNIMSGDAGKAMRKKLPSEYSHDGYILVP